MAEHCMMAWEGVIARPNKNSLAASTPIRTGVNLYEGLSRNFKIIIVTFSSEEEKVHHWFNSYGLKRHIYTLFNEDWGDNEAEIRLAQLKKLQGSSYNIDIVVDSNPRVSAAVLAHGTQALTFSSPRYTAPEFRPDANKGLRRTWNSIEAELDKQEAMAASDKRIRLVQLGSDMEE